jgi:hypothetical protein
MNDSGRPTVINDNSVAKLSEAFRLGFADQEACQYAEIDRSTYYRHLQSDAGFATQIASAKNYARMKCCSVLVEAIEQKNIQVCQWWLERRYREQFGKINNDSPLAEKEKNIKTMEQLRNKYILKS